MAARYTPDRRPNFDSWPWRGGWARLAWSSKCRMASVGIGSDRHLLHEHRPFTESPVPSGHTLSVADLCARLQSSPAGLTGAEAARRLTECGPNEIQAARRISAFEILLEQFKNVLIVILLAATALSAFLGHGLEDGGHRVIVLFAVLLGFVQEYRAERAIEALRKMAAPHRHGAAGWRGARNPGARPGARRRGLAADRRPGARRWPAARSRSICRSRKPP